MRLGRSEQEDFKFKVCLGYSLSSRGNLVNFFLKLNEKRITLWRGVRRRKRRRKRKRGEREGEKRSQVKVDKISLKTKNMLSTLEAQRVEDDTSP